MSLAKRSSGAKIRPYSPGTEDHLVRKRSPVRIRAWAPNSIRPFSLHLLDDFLSQRNALPQGFVSQLDIRGRSNQAFFSKVSYTAPGTPLVGYAPQTLAPVSRDEAVVRAIQRPGVRP